MLRDKIKKAFGSKTFYVIFSLLASFTIWLYIAYVENPDIPVNINNIKVEFINEDYLTDRSLVITKINPDTVSLRIQGRRNTVSMLSNSNIKLTANLTEIKSAGEYKIQYDIIYPPDINPSSLNITRRSTFYITVTVDTLVSKEVQVKAIYEGGVAEGYQAEPAEVTPGTITVSGPKNIVSKVAYAAVNVQRQNISKTVEEELQLALYDEDNQKIEEDALVLSQETAHVTIPVVMVKTVPLTVNLTPGACADHTNTVWAITPAEISLSGDVETLNSLNHILLGTIDLSQFLVSTTQTFKIAIPNGTVNLTGETEARVDVKINGLDSKHVTATNIQVINVASGYTANVITTSLDVLLRGRGAALEAVLPENVRVTADLSDLGSSTGIFSVLAKVYVDGDTTGVGAIGEYRITVEILPS